MSSRGPRCLIAVNGMLYGTTEFGRGGGTVFKISTTGKNEGVLHGFLPSRGGNPALRHNDRWRKSRARDDL
jgi:hypothetical protein